MLDMYHEAQNSRRWRMKAEEARAEAERMHDPESGQTLLDVASIYTRMADDAEALARTLAPAPAADEEHVVIPFRKSVTKTDKT